MPIIEFCSFHDLTFFCFSILASSVDHLKEKIQRQILPNLERMMLDMLWINGHGFSNNDFRDISYFHFISQLDFMEIKYFCFIS